MSLRPDSFSPFYEIDRQYIENASFPQKMRDTFFVFFGEKDGSDNRLFERFLEYSINPYDWKKAGLLDYPFALLKPIEYGLFNIGLRSASLCGETVNKAGKETTSSVAKPFLYVSAFVLGVVTASFFLAKIAMALPRFVIAGVLTGLSMPLVGLVHWCIQKPAAPSYSGGHDNRIRDGLAGDSSPTSSFSSGSSSDLSASSEVVRRSGEQGHTSSLGAFSKSTNRLDSVRFVPRSTGIINSGQRV